MKLFHREGRIELKSWQDVSYLRINSHFTFSNSHNFRNNIYFCQQLFGVPQNNSVWCFYHMFQYRDNTSTSYFLFSPNIPRFWGSKSIELSIHSAKFVWVISTGCKDTLSIQWFKPFFLSVTDGKKKNNF